MNQAIENAKVSLRNLPPSLNGTDEQALAIAEAQAHVAVAVAELLEELVALLTPKEPRHF